MSLSDRRHLLALLAAAPLAACGFTPAFAPGGPADGLTGSVRAADPQDQNSFDFVRSFEDRLGRPSAPRYSLAYKIETDTEGLAIARDNTTTRYQLRGTVTWSLNDLATGTRLTGGTAKNFTAWFDTGTTVATLAAREDAGRRLMQILADQIATQIIATAGSWS